MKAPFVPVNFRKRLGMALASGAFALLFFGAFASGPLAWGTYGLWVFSLSIAALSFALYGKID